MEQEDEPLKKSTRSKSTWSCKLWNPSDINWRIQAVLGLFAVTFFTLFFYFATRDDECAGRTWVHFNASSSSIPHCLRYDDSGHYALDASLCPNKCDAMFNRNTRLVGRTLDAPNGRRLDYTTLQKDVSNVLDAGTAATKDEYMKIVNDVQSIYDDTHCCRLQHYLAPASSDHCYLHGGPCSKYYRTDNGRDFHCNVGDDDLPENCVDQRNGCNSAGPKC